MSGCTWPNAKVGAYYHLNNEQGGLYVYIKIPITKDNVDKVSKISTLSDFEEWLKSEDDGHWYSFRMRDLIPQLFAAFQNSKIGDIEIPPGEDIKSPLREHPEVFPHLHTRQVE